MIDAVEPSAPEPIQVDAARVFHRSKEVGRGRTFEHPALGVGLEGVIEGLPAEDVFTQDIERHRGLAVGIGAEVGDGLGVGHHRYAFFSAHGFGHPAVVAARLPVVFPFGLSEGFHEGVEAFVHPSPLALIAVYDHWEVIVTDFVDDDADERILRAFGIGAVLFGARAVEADHRVFHTADGAVD